MINKISTLFLLFICLMVSSAYAQNQADAFYYASGSVSKRFDFSANDTVRFGIQFGTSRFEEVDAQTIGFHENALVIDSLFDEPLLYTSVFIDKLHADTISINLFSLPNLPFEAFSEITQFLAEQYYVPAYIASAEVNESITIREQTIRVPFPDTLFPPNPLLIYPDSADIQLKASYTLISDDHRLPLFPENRFTHSAVSIEMNVLARVGLSFGGAINLTIPLLENYPISIFYGDESIGFAGFSVEPYTVSWNSGIAEFNLPEISIPAIELNLTELNTRSSVDEFEHSKPDLITLSAYPNPFNPSTTITFTTQQSGFVQLDVFSILGSPILTIADYSPVSSGIHTFSFNASTLASGVYLIHATFSSSTGEQLLSSQKITLIK
jgi:hypothetical protein